MMLRFDPVLLRYAIGDAVIELPPAEMRVLNLLVANEGRVVETRDMSILIYGYACDANLINVTAARVRKRLMAVDAQMGSRLQTIRGVGYCWDAA